MDAQELAKVIAEMINDKVENTEAYVSARGDARSSSVMVGYDEDNKLFRVVILEET